MPQQFPLALLFAWVFFFSCGVGQFHHEQAIRRQDPIPMSLLRALEVSQLLWLITAIGILLYYFVEARWYWPPTLAIAGSMLGALIAGLLFGILNEAWVSKAGFLIWPLSAAWAIFTIHGLPA